MPQNVDRSFIWALKYDYIGELLTEVNFRVQSYLTPQKDVAEKALEFAQLEADTRELISKELLNYGVKMRRFLWLQSLVQILAGILLLPLKLVVPTRLWVRFIYRSTLHALKLYESQQQRWGYISPEFFARLVDHEVKQRDWARDYLARKK